MTTVYIVVMAATILGTASLNALMFAAGETANHARQGLALIVKPVRQYTDSRRRRPYR